MCNKAGVGEHAQGNLKAGPGLWKADDMGSGTRVLYKLLGYTEIVLVHCPPGETWDGVGWVVMSALQMGGWDGGTFRRAQCHPSCERYERKVPSSHGP